MELENNATTPPSTTEKPLSMAWYKFLTHFALIFGAVINLIYSISYISGGVYFIESNGEISAEQVYAYYGPGLQVIDIFYGLFLIAIAILAFILRHKLAHYELDSLKFIKIFYSLSAGIPFLYIILVSAITGQSLSEQAVLSVFSGIVLLIINIKYFKKRAHLFIDQLASTQPSTQAQFEQTHDINKTPATTTSTVSEKLIIFCRKCGAKLYDDSTFCHICGTNIKTSITHLDSNPSPVNYAANHAKTTKTGNNKPFIIGIISVLVVALLLAFIIPLIGGNSNNTEIHNVGIRTISFSDKFMAEYVLATWKYGEMTEQSMIDIMDKYGSEQGGGQLYIITRGEFIEEIDEWCFSTNRKKGDYTIIESAYGFSLCYYSGCNLENKKSLPILIVALEPDFRPYSWVEEGKFYGLHVDIAKEIANRNGFTVKFVSANWNDLLIGIEDGSYNLIFGIDPSRCQQETFSDAAVNFTEVYCNGMVAMFNIAQFELTFSEWINFKFTIKDMLEDGTIESYLHKYDIESTNQSTVSY